MNNGYIKLHRKILDWQWYTDIPTHILFEHLLLTVNWQDSKWKNITIKRGQRVTSLQHLSQETGLSVQQVRTSLNKLRSSQEITQSATKRYTLITIENYDLYQFEEDKATQTATNYQQTNNKQITTNEEYKNIRIYIDDDVIERVQKKFIECIGSTNLNALHQCITYLDDLPEEVIEIALEKTSSVNGTWRYAKTILDKWVANKIDTIDKVKIEDLNFKNKKDDGWSDLIDKVWKEKVND